MPHPTKRGLMAKPSSGSRKRQKVSLAPRRKVRLDEVKWREVQMPDRLEDYEGFFGLEEIDGVDVVTDEKTGTVSFEAAVPLQNEVEEASGSTGKELQEDKSDDGNVSWEGFSESEADSEREEESTLAGAVVVQAPAVESNKKKRKRDERSVETHATQKVLAGLPTRANGAFDVLADQPEDDETAIEVDLSAWCHLDLSEETLSALARLKFARPTPIQFSSIPEILAGHDVIGKASTGSGKTLAFGIPILESYLRNQQESSAEKCPIALIISPTRELAHQISAHLSSISSSGDFDAPIIATITGGLSVQKQRRLLETADIIVGTPGRLWEVFSSGHGLFKSLKRVRFLVIDEADRLLSEGHYRELGEILNIFERQDDAEEGNDTADADPKEEQDSHSERQTLVFSATFHKGLQQKLAGKSKKGAELLNKQQSMEYLLNKIKFREDRPKFIDANPTSQMASGLREGLIECAGTEKDLFLYATLLFYPKKRALIFTNSISAVRRLTPYLQNLDLPALPLHSQMPQKARLRSVERFTEREGSILVATDVAARGLDIPGVQLIVHYHLPRAADTYVHRSGRTARAEASGSSILICAPEEVAGVRRLVAKVHAQSKTNKTSHFIRTLDIDRRVVSRLKPRAVLAKKLADAVNAKEKKHSQDDLFREAAEDLGIDYDSDTFEAEEAKGKRGRGSGRKKKEKESRALSKAELQGMRAELKALLSQRVNAGVSARYLTNGGVDVDALLRGQGNEEFLGTVSGLGLEDDD